MLLLLVARRGRPGCLYPEGDGGGGSGGGRSRVVRSKKGRALEGNCYVPCLQVEFLEGMRLPHHIAGGVMLQINR